MQFPITETPSLGEIVYRGEREPRRATGGTRWPTFIGTPPPGPLPCLATYAFLPVTCKQKIHSHPFAISGYPKTAAAGTSAISTQHRPHLTDLIIDLLPVLCYKKTRNSGSLTFVRSQTMGGGESDHFLEGSVLGASFWRWWNRAWTGAPAAADAAAGTTTTSEEEKARTEQEFVFIAAVVPRPRPPRRPAKSKPIDIPIKKPVPQVPVFDEVAEDKRYWYQ